jgi:hypothetical protein
MLDVLHRVACCCGPRPTDGDDDYMKHIAVACIQLECSKAFVETTRKELLRHVVKDVDGHITVASEPSLDEFFVVDAIVKRLQALFADVASTLQRGRRGAGNAPSSVSPIKADVLSRKISSISQMLRHQLHSGVDVFHRLVALSQSAEPTAPLSLAPIDSSLLVCVCVQLECSKEFVERRRQHVLRCISEAASDGAVMSHVAVSAGRAMMEALCDVFFDVSIVLQRTSSPQCCRLQQPVTWAEMEEALSEKERQHKPPTSIDAVEPSLISVNSPLFNVDCVARAPLSASRRRGANPCVTQLEEHCG